MLLPLFTAPRIELVDIDGTWTAYWAEALLDTEGGSAEEALAALQEASVVAWKALGATAPGPEAPAPLLRRWEALNAALGLPQAARYAAALTAPRP